MPPLRSPLSRRPALRLAAAVLAGVCAVTAAAADRARRSDPPDPTNDPLLITAGFLEHHQDLKYRMLGMQAYREQRYDDALRLFRRASFFADKPSQGMVAEMYWKGQGTPRDPVQAYIWMDLAAERGYRGFLLLREQYWQALGEPERARVATEGQAVYARFGDAAAKPRYEHQLRIGRNQMLGSRTGFNRGVQIEIPGPEGGQSIPGSRFYDERYWDAEKYWAWQDKLWMKPRIGRVTIGEIESVETRIPETAPETDAQAPEVDDTEVSDAEPVPPRTP